MAYIRISSPDAARIAKTFNDVFSRKALAAIERRTVNKIGSDIRKGVRAEGPAAYGTSAAALMLRGQAARPGADDPEYKLRMATSIPVARLKARHRKATRLGSRLELRLDPPHVGAVVFRSAKRGTGRGFGLVAAGPLPERGVGGVSTKSGTAFENPEAGGLPELAAIRRRAEREFPDEMAKQINAALERKRR